MVKKYFIGSIAAIATLGMTTSCSNEDAFDASQDINVAKYEAAFKQKFGNPAPTQTWGFNDSSTRGTRTINAEFPFGSDAPADKFLATWPEGTEAYPQYGAASAICYLTAEQAATLSEFKLWGNWNGEKTSGGVVYIQGKCDFSSKKFHVASNTDVYLLEGAELIIAGATSQAEGYSTGLQSGCNFYIAPGAKLKTSGDFWLNSMNIYNHGIIEAAQVVGNGTSMLYNGNGGVVTLTGNLAVTNGPTQIVNDGEITAENFNTAGGAHLQNNGTMTINDKTVINSNNNTWVNNGQYTTEYFTYNAGSCDVINNCKLTVNEDFNFNLGDGATTNFTLDAGASIVTKNLRAGYNPANGIEGGPFRFIMGSGSLILVTGTATLNATKANYGFYAVGDDFALLQAHRVVKTMTGEANVTYSGKMAVVADEHFAQGKSGQYDFIRYENGASADYIYAPDFNEGNCPVTIEKSECNPGFGGGDFNPTIRVMAEDLTIGDINADFDFNDVVFDVQWTATGAKIRLNAAGGTLPLTIEGIEVHGKFAEANPGKNITTKTMMNTDKNARDAYVKPIFEITGNFKDANGKNDANLIVLKVNKGTAETPNWIELTAKKGKVAAKIGVDPKTDWCDERQDIEAKYSNFAKWVRGEVGTFY